jgi:uncharacterized integral membrane protein (TIGR00698 family)
MQDHSAEQRFSFLPGIALTIAITAATHLLSLGHPALDPLVLSILISIVIGNLLGPRLRLERGIALARRIFIPLGIILYGTQMDLQPLRLYGTGRLLHILVMVFAGLTSIYWLSTVLGISRKLSLLLAAGSVICGASAIMVLSPVIKAEKEDTSVSLLAITVVGLTGIILFPLFQEILALSDEVYALLCGSTLHQMGQVRAAAALLGQNVLEMAVPVKLLRIGTLLPIAIIYSLITGTENREVYIPWFIVGSLIIAVLSNLYPPLHTHRAAIAPFVTFFFSIAISGIGLSVDLESLIDVGPKPLLAAFLGWFVLIALFILGLNLIG